MTDWIKHVPGDPMPVDGDTVVEFQGGFGTRFPASWIDWKYITAYRIHKPEVQEYNKQAARHEKIKAEHEKEREMKYKAGDRVTFVIPDEGYARCINENQLIGINQDMIVNHEPAPEPIVGYVDYDPHEPNGLKYVAALETDRMLHGQTRIRITFSPATKEVKAEVVE